MNISSNYKPSIFFGKKYPTEDILSFTTSYPYKDKYIQPDMIKSLTGIDVRSDEFKQSIPKDYDSGFMEWAIISVCIDKVLAQNADLKACDDTFVPRAQNKQVRKENNIWFKNQIKKLGKTIDIESFSLTPEEVKKAYEDLMEVLNKIF